jgi:hypothetical protein
MLSLDVQLTHELAEQKRTFSALYFALSATCSFDFKEVLNQPRRRCRLDDLATRDAHKPVQSAPTICPAPTTRVPGRILPVYHVNYI